MENETSLCNTEFFILMALFGVLRNIVSQGSCFFCVLPPFPTLPSQFSKVWEEEKILFRQSAHLLAGHHKVTKLVTRVGFIWTRLASLAVSCSLENTDSPSF